MHVKIIFFILFKAVHQLEKKVHIRVTSEDRTIHKQIGLYKVHSNPHLSFVTIKHVFYPFNFW